MNLLTLEVKDFRGIGEATVPFGPGLTVLHGPNELGKSTLVEALRAALFLQTSSSAGDDHITWGRSTPACVDLTFEHSGKLWRVEKRFGPRRQARLSCSDSVESPRYREVAAGNDVEGRLRELLAWGIAPPGGRGAGPRLESFLLTALVGRQGEVQGIFEASLDNDRDDTGRALVTRALGALDKDPVVTSILDRLTARVDQVFTARDRRLKTSADSPLVVLQQALRNQEYVLGALSEADEQGRGIRRRVVELQDERVRLLGDVESTMAALQAANARTERASARAALQQEVDGLQRQLSEVQRRATELEAAEGQLSTAESGLVTLQAAEHAAAATLEATRHLLQSTAEAVARATEAVAQSGRVQEAARAQQRAELETLKATTEARLKEVVAAEHAVAAAGDLERESAAAAAEVAAATQAVAEAGATLDLANLRLRLAALAERQDVATRASAVLADALEREQRARERLEAAKAALADAERRRDGRDSVFNGDAVQAAESELMLLRAVEAHLTLALVRAEVKDIEAAAVHARAHRSEALARRSEASEVEQRVARRVLPTSESISAWRALEQEIAGSPLPTSTSPASLAVPATASLVVGLMVTAGALLWLGLAPVTAILAGLVVAAIVGGTVWVSLRNRSGAQAAQHDQFSRLHERWAQEVEPSLRTAGIANLAAFEGAVAEVDRLRADAQGLRDEANQLDARAVDAERAAAPLEARREALTRLEGELPVVDAAALSDRMAMPGMDVATVQRKIAAVEQDLERTRVSLRAAAEANVRAALTERDARQNEYEQAARDAASGQTALSLAQEQTDPELMAELQVRLDALQGGTAPTASVDGASEALEAAKTRHATAAAKAADLQSREAEGRALVERLVTALGGDMATARRQSEHALDAIASELVTLETAPRDESHSPAATLQEAEAEYERLEQQVQVDQAALAAGTRQRVDAERDVMELKTGVASRRGELNAVDRFALESRLQEAISDPAFAASDDAPFDPDATQDRLERLQLRLERCTTDLNQATGQLTLIAGHVGSERLAQQEDAVTFARAEVQERELTERAALRLLREIETVEAARATHLGRALAGPVTSAFRTLTGERYGPIAFAPDLRTEHVEAEGQSRKLEALSVGTREQLATLLRLAIAGHLQTAVVLDDQLVHSDSARLAWFSERLRQSARDHGHQVIVFTCRLTDYVPATQAADDTTVSVVDLAQYVRR